MTLHTYSVSSKNLKKNCKTTHYLKCSKNSSCHGREKITTESEDASDWKILETKQHSHDADFLKRKFKSYVKP